MVAKETMSIPYVSPYISALYPVRFDGSQARQSLLSPPPLLYVPVDPKGGVSSPACPSFSSPPPLLYVPHNSNLDPRGGMPSPLHLQQFFSSSFSTPSPQHNLNVLQQQYTKADPKETLPTGTNGDSVLSDDRDCVQQFLHQDSPTSSATPAVAKDHTTRRRLKRRMSDATNKKRYQCDVCRQRFLHRSDLITHMGTHKAGMPFQCNLCHKRFTRYCNLVTHMEQVYHAFKDIH